MSTNDRIQDWVGEAMSRNRIRGQAFEAICLAATAVGIISVLVLLLFVAKDALRPFSADTGWLLTFGLTVLVPVCGLAAYYNRLDEPAGEVAYVATGLPIVGLLLSGGFAVIFAELITVFEWFALVTATGVALGVVALHRRVRSERPVEQFLVTVVAPVGILFGIPPMAVVRIVNWAFATLGLDASVGLRVLSLRELILALPVLPAEWMILIVTFGLPIAGATGWFLARRRESREAGLIFAGAIVATQIIGIVAGPAVGIGVQGWILLVSLVPVPMVVYAEGVLRQGEGASGLVFPVAVVAGIAVGTAIVTALGFSGPETWLDWGFLTNVHNRSPADAGIYVGLVGSVMMLIVIVVMTFPVGVGAAIYLEEYAPSSGWGGRLVTLIEINIGNLAGVPSVVYGLLGLALFIRIIEWPQGSVIVGGLTVGLLILPIVIISAQEAIRSVPDSYREASYGMGATKWQTVSQVVLPRALPGILTGTILALGRAIGETAPLLLIGMAASVRAAPNSFFDLSSAMPRQIFRWSKEFDPAFRHGVLAAGVLTLLAVLLIMNGTAIIIRNKYQREQ